MKNAGGVFLLGVLVMGGCDRPDAANDRNFERAVNRRLAEQPMSCLRLYPWPAEIELDRRPLVDLPGSPDKQMAVLERLGLVAATQAEVDGSSWVLSGPRTLKVPDAHSALPPHLPTG